MIRLVAIAVSSLAMVGCGNSGGAVAHTSVEQQAVDEAKSLTPQQQLDRAEKSTMLPADQKAALIQSIKEKNGLK